MDLYKEIKDPKKAMRNKVKLWGWVTEKRNRVNMMRSLRLEMTFGLKYGEVLEGEEKGSV